MSATELPLALYLHVPWCVRKCPYCDFNSHAARADIDEQAYVDALIRDLDFELREPESRALISIFIGGGTPSLFSDRAIGRLLDAVAARLRFAPDIEITLEANPGTADASHFRGYRAAGVNRLSIGVQSLDAAMLQRLGRIHDPHEARRAVELARAAGFDNLNLDLMYALPQQSAAQAEADLRAALALAPEHLSYYQLTLEPNTEFAARPPPLPDDEAAWDMQLAGQALLAECGYQQYEVSAYARDGRQSRHNHNYWQFGDYLGLGAGAHAKRSFAGAGGLLVERRARQRHPRRYVETAGDARVLQQHDRVAVADLPFEFVLNALRLNDGFPRELFEQRTGLSFGVLAPALQQVRALGLIEAAQDVVRPTPLGRSHLNRLTGAFLP